MINDKTLRTLEFNKIMEQVAHFTSFSAGIELGRELVPSIDLEEARTWQQETAEVLDMLNEELAYSLGGSRDVREVALNAQRGVIIDSNVLLDIRYTLRRGGILKRNMSKLKGQYPLIA